MRLWVLAIAWGVSTLAPARADTPFFSGDFCVQTFQAYSPLYSPKKNARYDLLAAELAHSPCEATQLQNLWSPKDFARFASELKSEDVAVLAADSTRPDRKKSGLASVFRGEVIQTQAELFRLDNANPLFDWLPRTLGHNRGYSAYELQFENSPPLLLVNFQAHPTDSALRIAQIAQLMDYVLFRLPRGTELPFVLTAALPASPGSPEVALLENVLLLEDAFLGANGSYGDHCTLCAENPLHGGHDSSVSDYVFFRSSADFELQASRAESSLHGPPALPLSDHYGLRATFHWTLRTPGFSLEDEPLFLKRRELALNALEQAKALLKRDGRKLLQPEISLLEKIRARLEYTMPDSIRRMYRLR